MVGASSSCCTACENPVRGSGACFYLMGVHVFTHNCTAAGSAAGLMAVSEAGHEGLHPGRSAPASLRCGCHRFLHGRTRDCPSGRFHIAANMYQGNKNTFLLPVSEEQTTLFHTWEPEGAQPDHAGWFRVTDPPPGDYCIRCHCFAICFPP